MGQTKVKKSDSSFYKMVDDLVRCRAEIGHLDYRVMQKLDVVPQPVKGPAMVFFGQGAGRTREHLADRETLEFILKIHFDA